MAGCDASQLTLSVFPMYGDRSGDAIAEVAAPISAAGAALIGETIVAAASRIAAGEFDRGSERPDRLEVTLTGRFEHQQSVAVGETLHPITRLLQAASNDEHAFVERAAERAGLTWTCPVRPWTNLGGEPCEECGRTEPEARAHAGAAEPTRSGSAGTAGATERVPMRAREPEAGMAQLTPVFAVGAEQIVWHVRPDRRAARHFGVEHLADELIGGIVGVSGKWAVAAYRDRTDLLRPGGLTYVLPDARSRAHAARCLVRWWWWVARAVDEGADPQRLDPAELAGSDRRAVFS